VELMVTLLLSGLVVGVVLQLLVGDLQQVGRLGRWLRERQASQRTLELLRDELQRAERVSLSGTIPAGCGSQGRRLVLQISGRTAGGAASSVTYTYGAAPSSIWRGSVLMRCGPAYVADGNWSESAPVSRVLIDALPAEGGFSVAGTTPGLLRLVLVRQLIDGQALRQDQVSLATPTR
jgi:hypothetical protein